MSDSFTLHLLKSKGYKVVDISSALNVTPRAVYHCIRCLPNSSRRIRLYISSIVGRPPSLLFSALPDKVKILDDYEFMNFDFSSKNRTC